jgi:hypothetical protein
LYLTVQVDREQLNSSPFEDEKKVWMELFHLLNSNCHLHSEILDEIDGSYESEHDKHEPRYYYVITVRKNIKFQRIQSVK